MTGSRGRFRNILYKLQGRIPHPKTTLTEILIDTCSQLRYNSKAYTFTGPQSFMDPKQPVYATDIPIEFLDHKPIVLDGSTYICVRANLQAICRRNFL